MKNLLELIKKSFAEFFKTPILIILGIIFFVFLTLFSKIGGSLAPSFQTSFSNYAWVAFSVLLFLIIGGLVATLLIHFSQKSITKKPKFLSQTIKKSWHRSSLTLLMFLIFFNILNLILLLFTQLMIILKPHLSFSIETFRLLTILLSFFFMAGVIIFFSFTAFFIVIHDLTFFSGILRSMKFVKLQYINSLLLTVFSYAIITLINRLNNIYADIFNYALILPFMFFLLTLFVIEFDQHTEDKESKENQSQVKHKPKK